MLALIVRVLALIGLIALGLTTCHPDGERQKPSAPADAESAGTIPEDASFEDA